MADSVVEYLQRDMDCEGLLECIHGSKDLDRRVFRLLAERAGPLTVDDIADAVDRERSTAYRSVQRLLQAGFLRKEQVNYDQGGYYHVYRSADPDELADDMQRLLDDWHAEMSRLVRQFREKYDAVDSPAEITGESD